MSLLPQGFIRALLFSKSRSSGILDIFTQPKTGEQHMIDKKLLVILACPVTNGPLVEVGEELWCARSGLAYPVEDEIPVLLEERARVLSLDEVESIKKQPLS